jgi:branched-chain amino acid transport system substrate-binding protein
VNRPAPLLATVLLLAACGSGSSAKPAGDLLIVVNAPFSKSPSIGQTIAQGVELAVDQVNAKGGVDTGAGRYRLKVRRLDNALSPQKALDNVRQAVTQHALAIVDEGTGIDASWQVANQAHIPICLVYQGGVGLVDPQERPNVFRIAPTDHGVAFRLAEYMIPKGVRIAYLHDDSGYGQQGKAAFDQSFSHNLDSVTADITVPADSTDPSPEVLQARQSGATALLVWGLSTTIAQVIRAARSAGWEVPVYTPPSGEDPLVRQQLSDHPEWVDGLTFASGRMTAERGPGPFLAFQHAYQAKFGADEVGVKTSGDKAVIQPPDYAMYPFDFVNVLVAAVKAAHSTDPAAVLATLNQVDVRGANGDERGFNEKNHDGVVDDDVYFAQFDDMTYAPVRDDPLSSTLPVIPQTG